ncbi:SprT family protein [Lacticaseibacillus sp. GG6-2]
MTDQELQALVEQVSLAGFKLPFLNIARFNARLKTTGGRFHLQDQHLDFNPHLFAAISAEQQIAIIKHELCHYHLYRAQRGYQHKDADFKQLLGRVGGSRFAPALPKPAKHRYQCQRCGQLFLRQRRINITRFTCGRCGGQLRLI